MKQEAEFTSQAELTMTQMILKTDSQRFHKVKQLGEKAKLCDTCSWEKMLL